MKDSSLAEAYGDSRSIGRIFFWFIAVILAALAAGIVIVLVTEDLIRAVSIGISLPLVLAAALLVRRGRFQLAAAFLALVLMALCTVVATQSLGIHSISNIGFAAILIVASMVTRRSTMLFLTLFAVACLAWLVFGELAGWYHPDVLVRSIPGDFFTAALTIAATAFMVRLLSKTLFQSHERLRRELQERGRVEGELRESERRWQFALEGNGDGVWDWDVRTGRVLRSRQWKAMLGREPADIGEAPEELFDLLHPDDRTRVSDEFARFLGGGQPTLESEFRLRARDGSWRWILCRGQAMERDGTGRPLRCIGTHADISRRKQAEEALRRSEATMRHEQKLRSLGTLAGGVAHEINNPVNIIMNLAELIRDAVPADSPAAADAGQIISEGGRIARIVKDLLSFSRQEQESNSPARMRDVVDAVLSLTGKILARDQIRVDRDVSEDLPRVRCRSQQIMQVVMNLVTNARDALNERWPGHHEDKRLTITAGCRDVGGRRFVRTTVEDRGAGIPEAIRDRLFEPFFTTKPRDAGTGLGLAVSYGIVKEHAGELTFESVEGGPTRFHLDLPAAVEE
jgi:PAS domain S-box-containing protein